MGNALSIDRRINNYVAQMSVKEKEAVLSVVKAIVNGRNDEELLSDKRFIAQMDQRFKEMESGKAKLYTLDEAEAHARASYKAGKRKK
jgi:hypothetical protein